ncbi:MAG: DoxX family membrane protein [bacterium]|nr:DoxX family membrane protein [bacterium]
MRRIIDNDFLTLLVRIGVGIIFVYASAYKIVEPGSFAKSIWYYHMMPGSFINPIALILPWLELLVGLALVFGVCYRGAVVWANLMTVAFILALSSAIVRGISIDCGCFKAAAASSESAWETLWFDLVLILFTIQLFLSRSKAWMLARH